MHAPSFRSLFGALALTATLLLSACGGGDASPPAESVPPTVNIASSVVSGAAAGNVTFTFTFSEDVGTSFTAAAVTVTNGSKGTFTQAGKLQYTLVVTPTANSVGTIGITIPANVVADLVGNKMPVAATQSQGYDTRPPTVAISNDSSGGVAKGPVTFTFNFSKDVGTTFTADDVVVTGGGTKGAFARTSGTQASLLVTPTANSTGTLNLSIAAGAFADVAGTGNASASSVQLAFDTLPKTQMALPVNFDSATVDYGFIGFGGAENSSLAADPTNAANRVARVVRAAGSEVYAGTTITGAAQLGFSPKIPFNATDTRMSVRVYSPDAGIPVRLKVEDHTDPTKSVETEAMVTAANGWQTLTFNFAPGSQVAGTAAINFGFNYTKATIFFDFGRAQAQAVQKTYYFDDIAFVAGAPAGPCGGAAPTCAPTTAIPSGSVVIYSEAATVAGFNPRPDWGQSVTYSEATIAGNKSLRYTFQGGGFGAAGAYEGMDWSANPVNVSTKTKLHLDLWSRDLTSLKISIISAGKENAVTQAITAGSWNSVDIDLASYNVPDKSAIIQIKIESAAAGTVYIDNIYFWGGAAVSCGTTAPTCAPTTAIPAGSVTIYSEATTVPGFNPRPDWGQSVLFSEATIAGNKSLKYTFQGGGFGAAGAYEGLDWAANPVNVSSKGKLHLDLWSADITSMKISIISAGKENAVTQAITAGSWNSVDIDLASYNVPDKAAIIQIKIESATAGTVYIDNIHFWGTAAAAGGGGTVNPNAVPGSGGPVTIPVASVTDKFGFILAGDAIFAADYVGGLEASGKRALYAGATATGAASNGNIGYYNDNLLSSSNQKLEEGGWVSGSIDQQGVPNFFRYFVLTAPAATFSQSFLGLFVNAPNNGTVNVSTYANIRLKVWGPAEMYERSNLNPTVELIFAGPKIDACTSTGSGGTEIAKTFVANQKIGAGSSYKVALTGWTVKGVCGTDTSATAVASVLAKLARIVLNVPSTSFNFVNANPGATPSFSSGVNLGPIGFTNQ